MKSFYDIMNDLLSDGTSRAFGLEMILEADLIYREQTRKYVDAAKEAKIDKAKWLELAEMIYNDGENLKK